MTDQPNLLPENLIGLAERIFDNAHSVRNDPRGAVQLIFDLKEALKTRADLAPKVKPLIWHEDKKGSHTASPPEWRRCYVIVEFSIGTRWKYGVNGKWHDADSLKCYLTIGDLRNAHAALKGQAND